MYSQWVHVYVWQVCPGDIHVVFLITSMFSLSALQCIIRANTSEKKTFNMCATLTLWTVWLESSLFAWKTKETLHPWLSKIYPEKILIRLRESACWSEVSPSTHVWKYVYWWCGSMDFRITQGKTRILLCSYIFWSMLAFFFFFFCFGRDRILLYARFVHGKGK